MKITKSQFKKLIKEEVSKQKRIMEMQEKKQTILKELNEMGYGVEEEYIEEDESVFSPQELEIMQQSQTQQQPDEGVLEENSLIGTLKGLSVNKLFNALKNKIAPSLQKVNKNEVAGKLAPYEGRSFKEIKKMIQNKFPQQQLVNEGELLTEEGVTESIQKIFGYILGGGVLSTLFLAIAQNIMGMAHMAGITGTEYSLQYVIATTIVSLVIYFVLLIYNESQASAPQER